MYEIRQVIQRLRWGESDRDGTRAQWVGRKTVARVRRQALERGWLEPKTPLPEDREWAQVLAPAPTNRLVSSAAPFREQILAWHGQGITAKAIQQALARKCRFTGSVHTICRLLDRAVDFDPPATVILDFAVAEVAQVDFGQGPQIVDRATGEVFKTWFLVTTGLRAATQTLRLSSGLSATTTFRGASAETRTDKGTHRAQSAWRPPPGSAIQGTAGSMR